MDLGIDPELCDYEQNTQLCAAAARGSEWTGHNSELQQQHSRLSQTSWGRQEFRTRKKYYIFYI